MLDEVDENEGEGEPDPDFSDIERQKSYTFQGVKGNASQDYPTSGRLGNEKHTSADVDAKKK